MSYIALGTLATAYALWLNTERGRVFAKEYTWASVVIGTLLVLVSLRGNLDRESWNKVMASFVVAGIPVIGRSLMNKAAR